MTWPSAICRTASAGVLEHREEIGTRLQQLAANWDLHRMAGVDRNILRLATFDGNGRISRRWWPSETVDIAKRFSTDDSGKFVNGILDKLAAQLDAQPAQQQAVVYADLHLHTNYSDGTYTPEVGGARSSTTK